MELGSDMKLSEIKLENRILGNVPGACDNFLPPRAGEIQALKPGDPSQLLTLIIWHHLNH